MAAAPSLVERPLTAGTATVLAIESAGFAYAGQPVLRQVSLTVAAGEIYGLLGPNGAGKTTLVRALCGRVALKQGRASLDGRDLARDPAGRREIGLVPQEIGLYQHLSVRENLEVFGRLAGLRGRGVVPAVQAAARACQLTERLEQRVDSLSGGLARRANIAVALLHGPKLLILDEPTVGIDPDARQAIGRVIRALADGGLAVLLVTHDLTQAESLCDRVGLLSGGRLLLEGRPRSLVEARFAGRKELIVQLAERPAPEAAAGLASLGLKSDPGGLAWHAEVAAGRREASLDDWSDRLAGLGLAVRELRLREPGLAGLFSGLQEPPDARRQAP